MPSQTTVLITGANRGIGRGLVATYLLRPSHTVIAAVRDPNSTTSLSLTTLPVGAGSVLIAIPFDASSESSITNAINTLKTEHGHGVMSIQVVIANAGMATFYGSALQTPPSGMLEHYTTNVVGTLALFRVVEPLLKPKEEGGELPRFVTVSSTVGSIGAMEDWPMNATAYGASKAALNWLTKNIHIENEKLIAFPIHPGWVQTDMGNAGAHANGLSEAPTTIQESVDGILDKIDHATREKTSGTFVSYDGIKYPW